MDWWNTLPANDRFTALIVLGSALLGGVISLVTSVVVSHRAHKRGEALKVKREMEASKILAIGTMFKLLHIHNTLFSLKSVIDDKLALAEADGRAELDLAHKVERIVGADEHVENIGHEELLFVVKSKNAGLLNKIIDVHQHALTVIGLKKEYNILRGEYGRKLEEAINEESTIDGTHLSTMVGGAQKKILDIRVGQLNQLLWGLIEKLENQVETSNKVVVDFHKNAKEYFGADFPGIEFGEPNNADS